MFDPWAAPEPLVRRHLLEWFADGRAYSFYSLASVFFGMGSVQAAGTVLEDVLWKLVEEGYVEHSTSTPVLFRMRQPGTVPVSASLVPEEGDVWLATEQGVTWPGQVVEYDPLGAPLGGLVSLRVVRGDPPVPVGEPQLVLRTQLVRLIAKA